MHRKVLFNEELSQRIDGHFELRDATYWDTVKSLSANFNVAPVRNQDAFVMSVADRIPLWPRNGCDFRGSYADSRLLIQGEIRADEEKLVLGLWRAPGAMGSEIVISDVTMVRGDDTVELDPGRLLLDYTHQVWSWQYHLPENIQAPDDEDWSVRGTAWFLEVDTVYKVNAANPGSYQLGKLGRLEIGKLRNVRRTVLGQYDAVWEAKEAAPMIQTDFFPEASSFGGRGWKMRLEMTSSIQVTGRHLSSRRKE